MYLQDQVEVQVGVSAIALWKLRQMFLVTERANDELLTHRPWVVFRKLKINKRKICVCDILYTAVLKSILCSLNNFPD